MINFNPIHSSIEFSPGVYHPHVHILRISVFILSLSSTKVTTILSNGAISISRCTKHEQRSHIHVVRSRERTKVFIRLPGVSKGNRFPGARQSWRAFRALPQKNDAWSKRVNNSRTRFQYFIFHVQFFFFLYIFSYRICRYTFLANSKKLIPK